MNTNPMTTNELRELLPCPFCGGTMEIINCPGRYCRHAERKPDCPIVQGAYAIEQWNTRPAPVAAEEDGKIITQCVQELESLALMESACGAVGSAREARRIARKLAAMKTYRVTGFAFVPVKVAIDISAETPDAAMVKANRLLRKGISKYIVVGSEDYGAAFNFDATSAEPKDSL
jgi:hypothetical protein